LSIIFGMTETCGAAMVVDPDDDEDIRSTTVGRLLPHTEARISEAGELLLRGPRVTRGYHDLPEETAAAIDAEGWLHTGDLASVDERGLFRIEGRLKDLIKRGGE